jgi:hypothetical protein
VLSDLFISLGMTCLIAAPILIVSFFVLIILLGRAIAAVNPELWDEMKPGFYSSIWTSRQHRENLDLFLSMDEYRSVNSRKIDRLASACKLIRVAGPIALVGAVLFVFWAVYSG